MTSEETTSADLAGHGVSRVGALTVALVALTVALVVWSPHRGPPLDGSWWMAVLVGGGYAATERYVFHIEQRDNAMTFSISEVPTAFALAFLGPIAAIAARVVASLAVIGWTERPTAYKQAFNGALFAAELAVAYALLGWIVDTRDADEIRLVIGILVATLATVVVGAVVVSAAIACFGHGFVETLAEESRTTLVSGPIVTIVAALSVTPSMLDVRLLPLGIAAVAAIWMLLMLYGRLSQRHRDLRAIHDFTRSIGRSLLVDEIVTNALASTSSELRAMSGSLVVVDETGAVIAEAHHGRRVRDGDDDGMRAMHIPIRDVVGELGELRLHDRRPPLDRFDADDRHRAELLADRLATTLRNAMLHADLEHAALHDPLTGELNRRGFDARVDADLADEGRAARAVVILDLDRFKEINDTFGHHVGDEVLVEFARRVRQLLGPDDVLARFGGDEFAIYVGRESERDVRVLVEGIVSRSHQALHIEHYDVVVAVSAGVSFASAHDLRSEQLLRRADIAMYAAKRTHVGYETYRWEMDRRTPERLELLGELRDALDSEALEVHFQPKVDIASGMVVGAEALVRWDHPTRGWISPPDFILVAEESGLIRQLTDQVLRMSLRTAAAWRRAGHDLGVAVNLSALDLVDDRLALRVAGHLADADLPADRLTLEVTESSLLVDTPRTMATVEQLGELGVKLSLDDFGTGYSSLSYLRRLPAHELKVDRSFVSTLLVDHQDEVIVRSTIDLGHHLGMEVVAEGIEDVSTAERLRELGCDLGQGYGIARPMHPDGFAAWLESTHRSIRATAVADAPTAPVSGA
ncbi:putative bifunctional diguanylate cyclase/phosphodiesterase [Ilumatobacter sp.]|uniref:putative bifunctional diguanylate cyclase/phosphodiesterase n=1 Tax=Ilumatobacter sp. TaxID=1967498 RepID=UPI003B528268